MIGFVVTDRAAVDAQAIRTSGLLPNATLVLDYFPWSSSPTTPSPRCGVGWSGNSTAAVAARSTCLRQAAAC
ncbi:MAG: hypothetical protein ACRDST_20880 [Pseudonocardiaceae bacterium]